MSQQVVTRLSELGVRAEVDSKLLQSHTGTYFHIGRLLVRCKYNCSKAALEINYEVGNGGSSISYTLEELLSITPEDFVNNSNALPSAYINN